MTFRDIVLCTSTMSASQTLYILTQYPSGTFTPDYVSTAALATECPASSYYMADGVVLGDYNGDGSLSIILEVGVQFG